MSEILPVCVVIVNWQRPDDTIECVRSIWASETTDTPVLVVDNGSQDDSVRRISQALPHLALLALSENLGFAGGYNAGIKRALELGAQRILILNNDTIVERGTIRDLVDAPWDVSVPKVLFHDSGRIWAAGAGWRRFPPSVVMFGYGLRGQGEPDGPQWNQPRQLAYATGCALMVKRRVFEIVGAFDSEYESYMEDYDFCYRVRRTGFRIGYVPSARVLHKVSQSLGEDSPNKWRLLGRNTVLFYRKDQRFPIWMLFLYISWISVREILKGRPHCFPNFWRGVRDGFARLRNTRGNKATGVVG